MLPDLMDNSIILWYWVLPVYSCCLTNIHVSLLIDYQFSNVPLGDAAIANVWDRQPSVDDIHRIVHKANKKKTGHGSRSVGYIETERRYCRKRQRNRGSTFVAGGTSTSSPVAWI